MTYEYKKSWKPFAQLLVYIMLLNLAIFSASVGLHEIGHAVFGNALGCFSEKIVLMDFAYERGPYTELTCPQNTQAVFLGLSGFPFVILFGIAFLLLNMPEKHFGFVVLGLAVILSGLDMMLVVNTSLMASLATVVGAAFIILGETKLINAYIPLSQRSKFNSGWKQL